MVAALSDTDQHAGKYPAGMMATIAKVAGTVGLGTVTVGTVLVGSPWPLIVIGAGTALVLGTLVAVIVTAALSRSRGNQGAAGAGSADRVRARTPLAPHDHTTGGSGGAPVANSRHLNW